MISSQTHESPTIPDTDFPCQKQVIHSEFEPVDRSHTICNATKTLSSCDNATDDTPLHLQQPCSEALFLEPDELDTIALNCSATALPSLSINHTVTNVSGRQCDHVVEIAIYCREETGSEKEKVGTKYMAGQSDCFKPKRHHLGTTFSNAHGIHFGNTLLLLGMFALSVLGSIRGNVW